mgnify:CR=1 FL=1
MTFCFNLPPGEFISLRVKYEFRSEMLVEVPEKIVKYLDEYGYEASRERAKYAISEAVLPQDSVKVVRVYEVVDGKYKEVTDISSGDNVQERIKALEGLPVQVVVEALSRLK